MILAGQLLLEASRNECQLAPGWLRIEDGIIAELVTGSLPTTANAGDAQTVISPGFIDAHLHLPQFPIIGAHGEPLLQWLARYTFAAEEKWADASFAAAMTRRAIAQLLSYGTTGIAAYATVHFEATRQALQTLHASGMRGVVGQVLMDRAAPSSLCRASAELLQQTRELCREFPPQHRVSAAVTPRFAVTCSDALLRGAGSLAAEVGCTIQTHLAETAAECQRVRDDFGGRSYVEVYRDAGLLTPRSLFGHGVHLDSGDGEQLSSTQSVVVHCPTANSFLRSGAMNMAMLRQQSVRLALGSDIGAGYERSMVRVARAMIETAAALGDWFPSAAQAWHAITAGNAKALGWSNAGQLSVGAAADLVLIRPPDELFSSSVDRLSQLMFAWDDRWIQQTLLQGNVVYGAEIEC